MSPSFSKRTLMAESSQAVKPNFFIVGAPKAGSTSLFHYLDEHPEVFMSYIKETNFFSHEPITRQKLYYEETIAVPVSGKRKGVVGKHKLYQDAKRIDTFEKYESLFEEGAGKKAVGEASVSYLFYPEVPPALHAYQPEARIVMILRDPVERSYSHYLMDERLGLTNLSLEDVIHRRVDHPKLHLYYQQFVEVSLYYEQVKRYLDTFGKDQVKIIWFDDLKADTDAAISEVLEFIGVDSTFRPDTEASYNKFLMPTNAFVGRLYKNQRLRTFTRSLLPNKTVEKVKQKLFSGPGKPEMNPETRRYLRDFYREDVIALEKLTGRDLSHWRD